MENINYIKNLDFDIEVAELEGEYYILEGKHRVAYLLMAYLILKEKYKNDEMVFNELMNKLYINVKVRNK